MLSQTEAVVLNYTKYSESSIILHVLTEKFGRQSLLVYGIGKSKRNKLGAFHSLALIDAQIYYKSNNTLQKLKEHQSLQPLFSVTQDVAKSTLAIFLAEVIYRTVRESIPDERLYSFIKTAILLLENLESGTGVFHLVFLTKLARYMGFMPDENSTLPYYDFKEGHELAFKPHHEYFTSREELSILIQLLNLPFTEISTLILSKSQRNNLLEIIIKIYELHLLNFNSLKSFIVLKEVFSD